MMRMQLTLCAAVVLADLACALPHAGGATTPRSGIDEITWLVGCWRHTGARGTVIDESWTRPSRDTLAGTSRTQRAGAIVASEVMTIVVRGDSIVFIAEPSGQARTEFRATNATRQLAVFENPTHDFPQSVSYRPAGDSLHARIAGAVDGRERAIDFPMAARTCESVPAQSGG